MLGDFLSNVVDSVGSLFSGGGDSKGGGNSIWGPLLAAAASGGLQAYGGIQEAELANQQRQDENAQAIAEAEKQRQFEKELLLLKLANQGGGGGGGGGGSGAAMLNVRRQALADMLNSAVAQQGQKNDALALFLKGVQEPYARILGGQ